MERGSIREERDGAMYYRLPAALVGSGLSCAALVLYSVLWGRRQLSEKNGWRDEAGAVYVLCTNREMGALLGCGHDKATQVTEELVQAGLLRRGQRGREGRSPRLYPLPLPASEPRALTPAENPPSAPAENPPSVPTLRENRVPPAENPHAGMRKNRTGECGKSATRYIEDRYIEDNYIDLSDPPQEAEGAEEIKRQIGYDRLVREGSAALAEEVVSLLTELNRGKGETVRIGGSVVQRQQVRRRLQSLDAEQVRSVVRAVERAGAVRRRRAYLLTALYNAAAEGSVRTSRADADRERRRQIIEEYLNW